MLHLFTRVTLALAIALAAIAGSACGPSQSTRANASAPKASPSPQEPAAATELGDAQSGYHLVLAAKTIDGDMLANEAKPTVLVFFASWCGPCRQELATLGEIRQRFPTLRIIGINAYEDYAERSDQDRLRDFIGANAPWLTQIVHADPALLRGFGEVPNIPTLFIYDDKGLVVAEFRRNKRSPPSHEELEAAIASAVEISASLAP